MSFMQPPGSLEFKPGLYLPSQFHRLLEEYAITSRLGSMVEIIGPHMSVCHAGGIGTTTISLLDGGTPFYSDIRRGVQFPGHVPINLAASSYKEQHAGELVYDKTKLTEDKVKGRVVYVMDDIVESGQTMFLVKQELLRMGARQVITVVLLDKPAGRAKLYVDFTPDLIGFLIPDAWVFGYGMDDGFDIGSKWDDDVWPLDNAWVRNLRDIYYYEENPDLGKLVAMPDLIDLPTTA